MKSSAVAKTSIAQCDATPHAQYTSRTHLRLSAESNKGGWRDRFQSVEQAFRVLIETPQTIGVLGAEWMKKAREQQRAETIAWSSPLTKPH